MAFYHKLGRIPRYRHTTFYKPDGISLYREELFSTEGFSNIYSNKYHIDMPTKFLSIKEIPAAPIPEWNDVPLMPFHFFTDDKTGSGDFFTCRVPYLKNSNVIISTGHPDKNPDYYYKNAYHHEYIFIHYGTGTFWSEYGKFSFEPGDQIVVPKGVVFHMEFDNLQGNKILVVESTSPYQIPKHFRNEYGQLAEDAPFCERDIKIPEFFEPFDEKGQFRLVIKAGPKLYEYIVPNHPYDLVGWDGYLYPWALNIKDYAPKVGKIHLPPPVHLVLVTNHFVMCNFCPRLFDFHPQAIPAPYFHSNVDSAEVLYYVEGDFMSRKGIREGSVTLHPLGIPHGPQPGKTEESVGVAKTEEYAVMVDTFEPLDVTLNVKETMDPDYYKSWLE
jgi:homogentisate 1,2-dioxygenase